MSLSAEQSTRKSLLIEISNNYFEALRNANFEAIPFSEHVELRAPIAPGGANNALIGKQQVFEKWWKPLELALKNVKIRIIGHYLDEDLKGIFTKVEFKFAIPDVSLRVADLFIVNEIGEIVVQENHFDPRPLQVFGPVNNQGINSHTLGVHHIALRTMDRVKTMNFYGEVLGFPLILDQPDLLIYAMGRTFVAFKLANPRDKDYQKFSPFEVGLDHIALGCESEEELMRIIKGLDQYKIENTGLKVDNVLHKKYVAFKDPDRIQWEFYMI